MMKKIVFVGLLAVCCCAYLSLGDNDVSDGQIIVHCKQPYEKRGDDIARLVRLTRGTVLPGHRLSEIEKYRLLSLGKPWLTRITMCFTNWNWFIESVSRGADGSLRFDWRRLENAVARARALGFEPFIQMGGMPKALSSYDDWKAGRRKFNIVYERPWLPEGQEPKSSNFPPKDMKEWEEAVYRLIVDLNGTCGFRIKYWELWNEDTYCGFLGRFSKANFDNIWELYRHTVAAAERAERDTAFPIKIGGLASTRGSFWHGDFKEYDGDGPKHFSFFEEFMSRCAAERVRCDFVSYHGYAFNAPRVWDEKWGPPYQEQLRLITKWRDRYVPQAEIINSEWAVWSQQPKQHQIMSLNVAAAAAVRLLQEAVEYSDTEYAIFMPPSPDNLPAVTTETGDYNWGVGNPFPTLFAPLRKERNADTVCLPVFNGIRCAASMVGHRIFVENTFPLTMPEEKPAEPEVVAWASTDGQKVTILITNHNWPRLHPKDVPDMKDDIDWLSKTKEQRADISIRDLPWPGWACVERYVVSNKVSNSYELYHKEGLHSWSEMEGRDELTKVEEREVPASESGELRVPGVPIPRESVTLFVVSHLENIYPHVVRTAPGMGGDSSVLWHDPPIWVEFNERLDPESVTGNTLNVLDTRGNGVPGAVTYDLHRNRVSFTPSETLAPASDYLVAIGGVRDLFGRTMARNMRWSVRSSRLPAGFAITAFDRIEQDAFKIQVEVRDSNDRCCRDIRGNEFADGGFEKEVSDIYSASSPVHSGRYSVEVLSPRQKHRPWKREYQEFTTDPLAPGQKYYLCFWVYVPEGSETSPYASINEGAKLLPFRMDAGKELEKSRWIHRRYIFQTPADHRGGLTFRLGIEGEGRAFFDDMQLCSILPAFKSTAEEGSFFHDEACRRPLSDVDSLMIDQGRAILYYHCADVRKDTISVSDALGQVASAALALPVGE